MIYIWADGTLWNFFWLFYVFHGSLFCSFTVPMELFFRSHGTHGTSRNPMEVPWNLHGTPMEHSRLSMEPHGSLKTPLETASFCQNVVLKKRVLLAHRKTSS